MANLGFRFESAISKSELAANESVETPAKLCARVQFSGKAVTLFLLIELSIIIWNSFDHSLPCWDTVDHRLCSRTAYELFAHPHLRSIEWFRNLFAVSYLYPPLFYFVSASLKFALGPLAETELVSNLIFTAILFFSVYYIARETLKSSIAAEIAAVLVFLCPLVYWSTHTAMLDCAANAMVALGLAVFIWWTKCPSLKRSITLGWILGLVLLTKNHTVAFLLGPMLLAAVFAVKNGKLIELRNIGVVGIVAAVTVLPWVFLAGPRVSQFVAKTQQILRASQPQNSFADFCQNINQYVVGDLCEILTPILYLCFAIALVTARPYNKYKLYLLGSIIGGLIICSSFSWVHQNRYIVPLAVPISIFIAQMLARAWDKKRSSIRAVSLLIGVIAFLQFIYINFTPYPIHFPGWLNRAIKKIANFPDYVNYQGMSKHPLPEADWGYYWVLTTIERESAGKRTLLVVMPHLDVVNDSTYFYLTQTRKDNVAVSSSRVCVVVADSVTFNETYAQNVDWYVLKTGNQGRRLVDRASEEAYDRWCNYIHTSSRFKLRGSKKLPDQSFLELFQKS